MRNYKLFCYRNILHCKISSISFLYRTGFLFIQLKFRKEGTRSFPIYLVCKYLASSFVVLLSIYIPVVQLAQSCPTLCNPKDCSMPGFPVLHYLLEFAQTHMHWISDAIQPSHPLSSSSPLDSSSQHQGLFQWVNSLH